jgi:hypothetical protein
MGWSVIIFVSGLVWVVLWEGLCGFAGGFVWFCWRVCVVLLEGLCGFGSLFWLI